ncbi:acyl-CoA dehydrogenase family protein [Streptomyces sp. SAS_276]|uniref:acyl-CoA dehydrogenase family protein n=1 Tax=Streptomyces sp. SAS_276 TaxID=3412745 RepID=UPI00403CD2BC
MSTVTPADWQTGPAPQSAQDWIARAAEAAALLDTDAAARDRAGATRYAEVRLLKDSGLVTLLGETAAAYTRTKARSWLHGGYERAVDEPYVIDTYGDLTAKPWAVEALADTVAAEGQKLHDDPDAVTAKTRGDFEVRVAAVKARATDVALEIGNRIFEVTGARSTATTEGLDRFWRNVRTHPLTRHPTAAPVGSHDPVAYKRREVGRWVLEGELPEPTWYS